jgi:putative aminopeptidase FrvX
VGHGGAADIPDDVSEMISVDMGCVGKGLTCDETMVSICAKDSGGPYDYQLTSRLIRLAKAHDLQFTVDVYPYYTSDVDVALKAGHNLRHSVIGPGVYASHGYERSHVLGVENTFALLKAHLTE